MKTELIHISQTNMNRLFYNMQQHKGASNEQCRNKMKSILASAIENELTEKQRKCLIEHCLNGKKEKDIAQEQNISPSTVSRHITSAKRKLRRIASYYS